MPQPGDIGTGRGGQVGAPECGIIGILGFELWVRHGVSFRGASCDARPAPARRIESKCHVDYAERLFTMQMFPASNFSLFWLLRAPVRGNMDPAVRFRP